MGSNLSHFSINAEDVPRARQFYEKVFAWEFEAWGPPDFFQIKTGDGPAAVRGALQKRRELKTGTPTIGFECTFSVPDVDRLAADVVECGGRLLMEKTVIAGVGYRVFFEDPEGNVVGAMTYDPSAD